MSSRNAFPKAGRKTCSSALSVLFPSPIRKSAVCPTMLIRCSKHLSTVVKEISGKTAGEWIDSLVVLEAKALLKSSELSIQEIADELHFANQSFFGKYFKHHTGMSPKEYRRQ